MKKTVGLWVYMVMLVAPAFCQVDTSYIYNTSMPYGTLDLRIRKSDTRYYYLQENVTFSFRESSPGVKTNTFRDMTAWDSSPYKEGNLREKNGNQDLFVMNYRLLFPSNYDPTYDPGYPIIIMLHGYGERANCWNNNCYWSTTGWNPNSNSPAAPTSETHNLLNNDHNLLHGGLKHLDAVKLAGNRLPNDPTMPEKAFPGFVLFPQVLNGWQQNQRVEEAIKMLRLIIKKYNIDENRVYIHALSNGGGGLYQAIKRAPWLFAAALPMSAVSNGNIFNEGLAQEVGKIPMWVFQGAKDQNPTPSRTYNTVKGLRQAGASVRYYLYPHLGHGTWNTAYNEPDFFSWILQKRKYNPHVYYGNPVICNTNGAGVRISFSNGFYAYQWQRDGELITNASSSEYIANTPGTYRGRFSRVMNPSESDWEPWSDPIVVTEINPAKPTITAIGTTHLRGPGLVSSAANNSVKLKSDQEAELYLWYKNGVAIDFPGTDVNDTLRTAPLTSAGSGANGAYTLKTSFSYCPSPPSDPVYLFFNNSAPQNMTITSATADFKGVPMKGGVFLSWNDMVSAESSYEIWRRKVGDTEFKFAGRAPKNSISFFDGPLEPGSTYQYKLRAVGNTGVSNYVPANDLNTNLVVNTPADTQKPLPPQDLKVTLNSISSLTLAWKAPSDNTGIKSYIISYGDQSVTTTTNATSYTIANLRSNSTYAVSVKAVDHAGNVSEASNQIIGSTYVMGLFYKHSTGGWEDLDDTTLVATWRDPEFTGTVNNFTLTPRTQEDFFNFMFTGYFDALTDGRYIFRVTSNDGSRLLIDDALAVENDGVHGNVTKVSDTLSLSKGPHRLELQYFDYAGSQTLTVQYKGPDLSAGFKNIPDSLLRSGKYSAAVAPPVPENVSASGSGLNRIDVSWSANGYIVEVSRATTATGPFIVIGNSPSGAMADSLELIPGTVYYYRARTLSSNSMSAYSPVVSATTLTDNVAPTAPTNVTLTNKSHTNAALTWSQSSDNAGVKGYEIFVNGSLIGSSDIPAFMVSNLDPGTSYSITIKAVDASGNRSDASTALAVTTNPAATYYSAATGNLNELSTWKQNSNGTGNSPASFADNGLVFIIANRLTTGMGGPWEVTGSASKVIVSTGVTLDVDDAFTGNLELEGNAVIRLNNDLIPNFTRLSPLSTVVVNTPTTIPAVPYGNLTISGSGVKSLGAGNTAVAGNLTVAASSTLKGASGNASKITIGGNLIQQSLSSFVASDNRIDLAFTANASHTISTTSNLYAFNLLAATNSTVTVTATSPIRIVTGSSNGGGIVLQSAAVLDVGFNHLDVVAAGSINPTNETGSLKITDGNLRLLSSSKSSNLYFNAAGNTLDSLTIDNAGGKVSVRSPLLIKEALVIKNGELAGDGNITLTATDTNTAYLSEIGENGLYTGSIKVQQYIANIQDQRIELSGNVNGLTVGNWQNFFPITGAFAGSSGGSLEPSMFTFNGSAFVPYPAEGGSSSAPIEPGRGYHAKISNSSPFILEAIGTPYQRDISLPLIGNTSGGVSEGWNLVGNPYASAIVWNDSATGITQNGLSHGIALRETTAIDGSVMAKYKYYSSDVSPSAIPPGHAFWVRAVDAAPTLTLHEKAKGTATYAAPSNLAYLIISLKQGAKQDETYLLFKDHATDGFDPVLDLPKRSNEGLFNLSTSVNGSSLAINAISKAFCNSSVSLNITDAAPGAYVLSFSNITSLEQIGLVQLHDNFLNTSASLTSDYSFEITSDPLSAGAGRFTLTFARNQLDVTTPMTTAQPACSQQPALITIANTQAGVAYVAINSSNQVVSETVEGNGESINLFIPVDKLVAGDNLVKIQAGFPGCTTSILQSAATVNLTTDFSIEVPEDISVCVDAVASLTASGVPGGGFYRWYNEDGELLSGKTTASIITDPVKSETSYQVAGVLANGCETERYTIRIYADTLQVPQITMYHDTLFAQVDATFQWYRNGNIIAGATQNFFVPTVTGNYTVVASSSGCSKESLPYTHVIDPDCVLDTSISNVSLESTECGPESYRIQITNTEADVAYSIINVNDELLSQSLQGNGSNLTLELASTALDSGKNRIRIRTDKESCIKRTLDQELDINNLGPVRLTLLDTVKVCTGDVATLSVSGADLIKYEWFDPSGTVIDSEAANILITPAMYTTTKYSVRGMHSSECWTATEVIAVIPVTVEKPVIVVDNSNLTVGTGADVQWYLEGVAIPDATSNSYRPLESGNYSVKAVEGTCEVESVPVMYVMTGTEQISTEFELHAYPVPSSSKNFAITVFSPAQESILIQVLDLTGRTIFKKWFTPRQLTSKTPLPVELSNGLYSIIASQGTLEIRKRIVIQN